MVGCLNSMCKGPEAGNLVGFKVSEEAMGRSMLWEECGAT